MKALALIFLTCCTFSFEGARLASKRSASSVDEQRLVCRGIDRERAWYGAGAAIAGACSAGTGVPAIVDIVEDKGMKTAFQVTMVVCAVGAAGLVILRDSAGTRWVAEGCGQ